MHYTIWKLLRMVLMLSFTQVEFTDLYLLISVY